MEISKNGWSSESAVFLMLNRIIYTDMNLITDNICECKRFLKIKETQALTFENSENWC